MTPAREHLQKQLKQLPGIGYVLITCDLVMCDL